MYDVIFIIIGIALLIFNLKLFEKCKSPIKTAFLCMGGGVVSLILSSLVLSAFKITLMVNTFTVFTSLTLGISGTIFLVLKIFI